MPTSTVAQTPVAPHAMPSLFQKSIGFAVANARYAWLPLCLIAGLISLALGQDACWDLQNYHLYNAFALFHPHRHDVDIAQSQTFLNPLLDIPLYLLTITFTHTPQLIAIIMGLPFGVLALFTFRIAFRLFGWQDQKFILAVLAALFGLTGTATAGQLGLSTNEIQVAALVIAGFDMLLIAIADRGQHLKPLILAGLLTGLAVGAKLTASPYAIGLAAAAMAAFPMRRLPAAILTIGAAGAIGVGATGGFWMAHLYTSYGDPIFPYSNQIFQSPWAGPWAYNDTRFFPHSIRQWLFYPLWWLHVTDMVVTDAPFADPRFAALLIIAPMAALAALFRRRLAAFLPPPEWRAVIIFWLAGYIMWERLFSIYRYAIPLEIIGGMIFAGALRTIFAARPRLAAAAAALLLAFICTATTYPNWGRVPFHGSSLPFSLPALPPRSLVVSTGPAAVSFLVLRAPPGTVFVGANGNFDVPDSSLIWRRLTSTIENWHGPIEIIEPVQGDTASRDIIAAEFNLAATAQCQQIRAAWNYNALRLCTAHFQGSAPDYQPAISFGFSDGDPGIAYLRDGWATSESFGRWTVGNDATLVLPVNPANHHPLRLTVLAFSVPSAGAPGRHVMVYANGSLIARWALTGLASNYQATIPDLGGATQLTLRFHIPDAYNPYGQQSQGDDRPLGMAAMRLSVQEIMAGQ